jgi:hypothetical protein
MRFQTLFRKLSGPSRGEPWPSLATSMGPGQNSQVTPPASADKSRSTTRLFASRFSGNNALPYTLKVVAIAECLIRSFVTPGAAPVASSQDRYECRRERKSSPSMPIASPAGRIHPRRAGKTTLFRHTFPKARYILLEDPDIQASVRSDHLPAIHFTTGNPAGTDS